MVQTVPACPPVLQTTPAHWNLMDVCDWLNRQPHIENCTVYSLSHMKEKESPQHEYLIVHICICDDENMIWRDMKIERTVTPDDVNPLTSTSIICDKAWICPEYNSLQDNKVETLDFDQARVPLSDFTSLFRHSIPEIPHYADLQHQSHRFCCVTKEAARRTWHCNTKKGAAYDKAGWLGGSSVLSKTPKLLDQLLDSFHNTQMEQGVGSDGQLQAEFDVGRAWNPLEIDAAVKAEREKGKAVVNAEREKWEAAKRAEAKAEREKWEAAMRAQREEHRAKVEKLKTALEKLQAGKDAQSSMILD